MSRTLHPGFRFKEGRLFIFTDDEIITIDGWPGLASVRKEIKSRRPVPYVPAFRLLKPRPARSAGTAGDPVGPGNVPAQTVHADYERAMAFNAFRYTMPPEVAEACERFAGRQWRVLTLCADQERAVELVALNPALAFCLAHHASLGRSKLGGRGSVQSRQRDIAAWLDFPDAEAVVRILRKIPPESVHLERLRRFRESLKRPEVLQLLGHLDRINAGVMNLVFNPLITQSVTPRLLAEVSAAGGELEQPEASRLVRTFQEMWRAFETGPPTLKFGSLARLREQHRELSLRYSQWVAMPADQRPFPAPPLPGTAHIIPLLSAGELRDEGREQHNCVASYDKWVMEGGGYVYRVLQPERATLSIIRGSDGCWRADELKLKGNQPPSEQTVAAVNDWLGCYSLSA